MGFDVLIRTGTAIDGSGAAPGRCAEVVVFDSERVADGATWEAPRRAPVGIDRVIVNGQTVIEEGRPTGLLPGRVLRRQARESQGSGAGCPLSGGRGTGAMTVAEGSWPDVLRDDPALGQPVSALPTPVALVDLDLLEANIATMAAFFRDRTAKLRPHVKTHRAPAIARLQVAAGAAGITAPKVSAAEAMVDGGIDDVYVANQVVAPPAIARLCRLAQRARVRVAVDHPRNVADLSAAAQACGVTLDVVVEVDAGMGRCGTAPGAPTLALAQVVARSVGLRFAGLHVYEGHVVQDPDPTVRKTETERMLARAMETRDLIERHGLPVATVTCGGTGTYDVSGVYPGVTEHQSGSYVYMDPEYRQKVPAFGLAFSVLSTVVSRPTPERVVTDGGLQVVAGDAAPAAKGQPALDFHYLSEEHGTFIVRDGERTDLAVGDRIEVYPGHCCAAANLHDRVHAVRNGAVEAVWAVTARGKSQ